MTPTETMLFDAYHDPVIPLDSICGKYLNIKPAQARQRAARNTLGFPTFKLGPSQKAALMVSLPELAKYLDRCAADAKESWESSQV